MVVSKQTSFSAVVSTVASLAVIMPILWFIGRPLIADALAEDFRVIAQETAAPMAQAFSVLLTRDMTTIRREIAQLKYRQRRGEDWTSEDAAYLTDLEIEYEGLKEAKRKLHDIRHH